MMRKVNGWRNYDTYSGRIEPRLAGLLERPLSHWLMELRLSSLWKLASRRQEPVRSIQKIMMSNQKFGPNRRKERRRDGSAGLLSAETEAKLWCQHKVKAFNSWWPGITQSCGSGKESILGKIRAELRMTLSHYLQSWQWSIFFRRSGRTCSTTSLECK